jgi:Flp pilus assembly protein TadG
MLLPVLIGFVGLVIDTGLMLAAHRQVQNVADSAALAAATRLMRGEGSTVAKTEALTFINTYNGLSNATVTVNIGAQITQGPYAGGPNNVEVLISNVVTTAFMKVLGTNTSTVSSRAVASFEPLLTGEGIVVLSATALPGLSLDLSAVLTVNGNVVVNSQGKGFDQYGQSLDWGSAAYAITTASGSSVSAGYIQVRGGVDNVGNFSNVTTGGASPLFCGAGIAADPFGTLAIPTQANTPSITNWTRQNAVSVGSGQTVTLQPGVYKDIQISGTANVTFSPGVYILSPESSGQGLGIQGSCTVSGAGVMFYSTASDYLNNGAGYYDSLDGAINFDPLGTGFPPPPAPPDPSWSEVVRAKVSIQPSSGSSVTLSGLSDSTSPFNNLLLFQRRRNTNQVQIGGANLGGTLYAKWAPAVLSTGTYNAQFVMSKIAIPQNAQITIGSPARSLGAAGKVYLVE